MATVIVNGKRKANVREGLVRVVTGSIEFASKGDADIIKITDDVAEAVAQTGLKDGTVTLFVPGATGALTTLEFEPGDPYVRGQLALSFPFELKKNFFYRQ